jgi:hypothetical protein
MFVVLHNRYGNTIDSNTMGCIKLRNDNEFYQVIFYRIIE